jgi:trans-feruloyl-CoA hydratase/vanillin synthase|tara:strand:+ start:146 stop:601 length:456 start_codon:yes stop_codon:yes gene_type:complete
MSLCDFAIASERAVFGLSEINFATIPSAGAMWAPTYHLHPRDALYLAMTGERIDSTEAERIRLVNRRVPHEKLREEVLRLSDILKQKDPVALMVTKETFRLARNLSYEDSIEWEVAKSEENSYLQKGLWVEALKGFSQKKFKPGIETYKSK